MNSYINKTHYCIIQGDPRLAFHFLEQIGGAQQPGDFYEIVGHDAVHVRRFNTEGQRYTIRFRNMDQVDNFPGLVPQIFQDLIDRVLQNVRKLFQHPHVSYDNLNISYSVLRNVQLKIFGTYLQLKLLHFRPNPEIWLEWK